MTVYLVLYILSINSRMNGISLGLESCPNIVAHTISSSLCAPLPSNNALASNQLSFTGSQHTTYLFDLSHINTNKAIEVQTRIISIIRWYLFCCLMAAGTYLNSSPVLFKACKDGLR